MPDCVNAGHLRIGRFSESPSNINKLIAIHWH